MRFPLRLGPVDPAQVIRFPFITLSLSLILSPGLSAQALFTVNTTNDVDDGTCDVVHCSLREAITASNLDPVGGIIHFSIPGAGPHTIQPFAALPALEGNVIIDGTSEPDFTGTPVIELDGSLAGGAHGLDLVGSQNLIRGLIINRFAWNGISINTDCTFNLIEGNFIGTDVTGTLDLGNGNAGVLIGQAADNTVGGTAPGTRNLISGNPEGVTIVDPTATGNVVAGNYIGTDVTGTLGIPNGTGVLLLAPDNTIGGTASGSGNLISGNTGHGISLGPPNATGNVISGNYVGVDATGTIALGNDIGVWLDNVADNVIGGTSEGARNVISGNREGIGLWEAGATGNLVQGNYLGTDQSGDAAIPNEYGLVIYAPNNTIGGTEAGAGNLISGNQFIGINLFGENASGNTIQGNLIGTDLTGAVAIGNGESGIAIHSAPNNTVGGTDSGARNVLSGNAFGILIADLGATGTVIRGNYIGTNAVGNGAIPNTEVGVLVWGENTTIGGTEAGAGNVISGNTSVGIGLAQGSSGTVIQGNYIGTDVSGTVALEGGRAMSILDASGNTIGGTASGAGNYIAGNGNGILIDGPNASGNVVQGNLIGVDVTGLAPLENGGAAVRLSNGAAGNTIGGTASGAGNIIANSRWMGVILFADAGTGNRIQSNAIFDNSALGIELGRNSVTPNDEGDADTGPNNLQNFPVLTSVASSGGAVIQASLNSAASSSFTLEFFSNIACDDSGFGQGETPLGTAMVTTDASGNGTVAASFSSVTGDVFTATATDVNGNTSEFSLCSDATTLGVSSSPTTRTVTPGQSATYNISVGAQGGVFEETVDLTCSGAPAGTTCTFASDELTLTSGQASTTMTVTTVAPATSVPVVLRQIPRQPFPWSWALLLCLSGILVVLVGTRASGQGTRIHGALNRFWSRAGWIPLATLGAILLVLQISCGKDGSSPPTGGTPVGTYQLTVTATWESAQETSTVTLVVQ